MNQSPYRQCESILDELSLSGRDEETIVKGDEDLIGKSIVGSCELVENMMCRVVCFGKKTIPANPELIIDLT